MKSQPNKQFPDSLNTAVFTTKYVIDWREITYVTHDADDGAWQFFSDDELESFEEVAKIVSLQEILDIDPTLLDLADMPTGYYATRTTADEDWVISKSEE
jgi:hypothetical protein